MIVDYELVWLRLKGELSQKRSWGADQVLLLMNQLEVENQLPEGERDFDSRPASLSGSLPSVAEPAVGPVG